MFLFELYELYDIYLCVQQKDQEIQNEEILYLYYDYVITSYSIHYTKLYELGAQFLGLILS